MAPAGRLHTAILFGGRSGEHPISIRSARSVVDFLDRERFDLVLVGIDRAGAWHLMTEERFRALDQEVTADGTTPVVPVPHGGACGLADPRRPERVLAVLDVVFPVLHGPYGEDGTIQGLFEMLDIPYVGCGVLGSAVCRDKDVLKRLLREAGVPVVPFDVVTARQWERQADTVRAAAQRLGYPVFVKPARTGSSLGVSKVRDAGALDAAVASALALDAKILIERGVDAREIECAVLGNDEPAASIPGEVVPGEEFYSYEDKYAADSKSRLLIPAPLSDDLRARVQALAAQAFRVLEGSGLARVDFFLERGTDRLFVSELNTMPGFTSISMYPKLWEASGLPPRALVTRLLELAIERHRARRR